MESNPIALMAAGVAARLIGSIWIFVLFGACAAILATRRMNWPFWGRIILAAGIGAALGCLVAIPIMMVGWIDGGLGLGVIGHTTGNAAIYAAVILAVGALVKRYRPPRAG